MASASHTAHHYMVVQKESRHRLPRPGSVAALVDVKSQNTLLDALKKVVIPLAAVTLLHGLRRDGRSFLGLQSLPGREGLRIP